MGMSSNSIPGGSAAMVYSPRVCRVTVTVRQQLTDNFLYSSKNQNPSGGGDGGRQALEEEEKAYIPFCGSDKMCDGRKGERSEATREQAIIRC